MRDEIHNNIGYACTTLQCDNGLNNKVAMRWIDVHSCRTDYTFGDLERQSNSFANVLTYLGIGKGDSSIHLPTQNAGTVFCFPWHTENPGGLWHSFFKLRRRCPA